jgi:hypothetical protein
MGLLWNARTHYSSGNFFGNFRLAVNTVHDHSRCSNKLGCKVAIVEVCNFTINFG